MRQRRRAALVAELGFVEPRDEERAHRHGRAVRRAARRRKARGQAQGALTSFLPSPGGSSMRRHLFASSLSLASDCRARARRSVRLRRRPPRQPPSGRCSTSRPTPKTGKIIATLPKPDADGVSGRYIYLTQLETGLGSAPIGLDRAAPSSTPHPRLPPDRQEGRGGDREPQVRRLDRQPPTSSTTFATPSPPRPSGWATWSTPSPTARSPSTSPASSPATTSACRRRSSSGGGGEFKFVPELSAADPNFVKVFPRNAEFAAQAHLPLGRADGRGQQHHPRQPDLHADRCAIR